MRVSRLEIFGFKSFMERTVLPLEAGFTGVVGPNGCGKSNIIDALRWVLGESRASNLRGGVLEDVIFNGTDKLRPLGLAEVTITLRATSEDFFSDLVSPSLEAELIAKLDLKPVTPDVDEAAPSENERPRLTVIEGRLGQPEQHHEELDQITGLPIAKEPVTKGETEQPAPESSDASSTPSQSEVSPEVSPEVSSESAAEAPTTRAEEDDEKQDVTMLTRFSWLKSVSEVQVTRRLYRSGESEYFINRVACRLKDLKEFFRAVGIGARAYTIVAQGEVTRIISAKPDERRLILEEAAGVLGFRDKIAAASRRLEETSTNVARLDDVIKEVTRQVNSLRQQAARARNRQALKEQITALDKMLLRDSFLECSERRDAAQKALSEITSRDGALADALENVRLLENEAREELARIDLEADDIRLKIDANRDELERRAQQRARFSSRINELRAFILAKTTEIRRLEEQLHTLAQRDVESQNEVAQLSVKEKDFLESLEGLSHDSTEELREIASHRDNLRGKLREQEASIREIRDRMISAQSSIKALEEQIVESSPLNQLRENTGSRDMDALRSVASDATLFAEGLSVPGKYAKAVQSFLAERAKFIVSSEPQKIASYFVEHLNENKGKGGGIGIFQAKGTHSPEIVESDTTTSSLPKLLSLITSDERCTYAASHVFHQVFVAETLEEGFKFFDVDTETLATRGDAKVVTLEGDIVTPYSFFSLRHEGGLIQLKRRVEDLKEICVGLEDGHATLAQSRDELQAEIRAAEDKHALVLRESQERQAKAREFHNQLGNIRGRLHASQRLTQQITQDTTRVHRQIEEAHDKIREYQEEELRTQEEMKQLVPDASAPDSDSALHEQLREFKAHYDVIEGKRRAGRFALSDLAKQVEEARRAVDNVRNEAGRFNLEVQKVDLEVQNILERAAQEYGSDALRELISEEATQRLDPQAKQENQAELQKLRNKIAREGDVDPSSIDRFEEENARLMDLERQKTDLETAGETLRRTIARLTETSERRFLATFNAVRENFSRLIPRLFGGGKGSIDLTDPAHPLESGVEIMTRPPGKKPKSIELLSGGEKALCATALIIAMFLERPSPLCVLDEVDAPLDEANLVRFLSIIKEMSTKTQFVVITHNKQSMAVADTLVGVTQQEPGASKLIAVSLQDAYSQVA